MGKINRIQLRGISRTPSDRMNNDGGVAESLNMYIDEAESAPALLPKDVTSELGLPDDLVADKVFIHKTASYENVIVQSGSEILAYVDGKKKAIFDLSAAEKVNDIVSVGNTIIISTSQNLYYALMKEGQYRLLGSKVPFPYVNFTKKEVEGNYSLSINRLYTTQEGFKDNWSKMWFKESVTSEPSGPIPGRFSDSESGMLPEESAWTKENFRDKEAYKKFDEEITTAVNEVVKTIREDYHFYNSMFVRYALELYDGTELSSMPIYIHNGTVAIDLYSYSGLIPTADDSDAPGEYVIQTLRNKADASFSAFDIEAQCMNIEELKDWTDIAKRINIYVSDSLDLAYRGYPKLKGRQIELSSFDDNGQGRATTGKIIFGEADTQEQAMNDISSLVYRIKSIDVTKSYDEQTGLRGTALTAEVLDLKKGIKIDLTEYPDPEPLREQPRLGGDDMKHYVVIPEKLATYNNSIIAESPSKKLLYDYNTLNSVIIETQETEDQDYERHYKVEVQYTLQGAVDKLYVKAGPFWFKEECKDGKVVKEIPLTYQTFPDSRAIGMDVKLTEYYDSKESEPVRVSYGYFEMAAHPLLDMAYHIGWYNDFFSLFEECDQHDPYEEIYGENIEDKSSQIMMSKMDNPFSFPVERTYTFQSRVRGVAIASTALSQGQFGQFPLYVFTEDGIWAMETAADGSFVTSKPLSRDVCVNPDSITSIDNAVVFVTDKGVMLLQGSQVVNISPHMHGKHYTLEESAKVIVNGQEDFKDLIPVVKDDTHFMAFVKEATIAYDYPGKRLIFIKKDEAYQYIYKLDTSTWHKTAYGVKITRPLNSYPDALVQAEEENLIRLRLYVEDAYRFDDQTFDLFYGEVEFLKLLSEEQWREMFFGRKNIMVTVTEDLKGEIDEASERAEMHALTTLSYDVVGKASSTRIYNLSTPLDVESQTPTKGIIVTRPFDLDAPDELKSITDLRIRGQYTRGAVKYILLGSMDGHSFHVINTKRGKSWKLFRLIILADLKPTERISWVDVEFEQRFNNRLR